jgi:Peptidase family M1 domain
MRLRCIFVLLLSIFSFRVSAADSPRDIVAALNALRLDPQAIYLISAKDRIEIHQPDVTLYFTDGKLVFFQPYEGRITGFVFSGVGHALALPRDPVEKQQLARFLGAPILDQQFFSGCFRFTDDTAQDLLSQFQRAGTTPSPDTGFLSTWQGPLERLNPNHSLRILFEKYYATPRHFFHAGIDGAATGPFDILIDYSRNENFLLGQPRQVGNSSYYDIWSSYTLADTKPPVPAFRPLRYRIDTTIQPDYSLEGRTSVDFRTVTGNEQILFIALARSLKVDSVSLEGGEPLMFFQNEGLTEQQLRTRGDDILCVFLPKVPPPGNSFTLNFRYRGNVIANAGNGVLFVGSRESWYPHFGDAADFSFYDLTIRWPKRLRLVATGDKTDEREDGEFRAAHWTTPQRVPEAGFNLGEYVVASVSSPDRFIDVYANRQLEQALLNRLSPAPISELDPALRVGVAESGRIASHAALGSGAPSPADALKQLAREIDSSIHYYEQFSGPFPFRRLSVSQIPGVFGQGWPGLLYLSTYSFLPHEAQQRAGLTSTGQEQFSDIIPFHEVAHQWWGNVVGWSSYRDQWLDEGIAAYLSLMFADSQKNSERAMHTWLERYRKRLTTKNPNEDLAPADVGPLTMGSRLSSSKSPEDYDVIIYSKGAWVMHMLREMLRQPNTANPDARFKALLRTLSTKYAQASLSTAQLQREVEAVMTPKMDLEGGRSMEWFFDQYVRGTGIPRYKVDFSSHRIDKGFQVRGTLHQSGVPRSFIAPVPLYVNLGPGKSAFLGTVMAAGEETHFSFTTPTEPHKLQIDPYLTLLCVPE